jgi:hypothetical protein
VELKNVKPLDWLKTGTAEPKHLFAETVLENEMMP